MYQSHKIFGGKQLALLTRATFGLTLRGPLPNSNNGLYREALGLKDKTIYPDLDPPKGVKWFRYSVSIHHPLGFEIGTLCFTGRCWYVYQSDAAFFSPTPQVVHMLPLQGLMCRFQGRGFEPQISNKETMRRPEKKASGLEDMKNNI